jgi:hypothetical protein
MFYDLTLGDRSKVKIPKQPERRERELRDLMRKNSKRCASDTLRRPAAA